MVMVVHFEVRAYRPRARVPCPSSGFGLGSGNFHKKRGNDNIAKNEMKYYIEKKDLMMKVIEL